MVSTSEFLNTVSRMEDDYNKKVEFLAKEIMTLQSRLARTEFEIEKLIGKREE